MKFGLFACEQRVDKGAILRLGQGAVDVIGAAAAGAGLVVARLKPRLRHVDGVLVHDRRDGVEKGQGIFVRQLANVIRQCSGGEGAGRDYNITPIRRRQARDLAARNLDQGMLVQRPGDGGGKSLAVDCERSARGDLVGVGRAHDERAKLAHLGMQQANRIVGGIIGAKRVGADKLGKPIGAVSFGHAQRAHLVQDHADAALGDLPGGLRPGEAGADDMNGFGGGFGPGHGTQG